MDVVFVEHKQTEGVTSIDLETLAAHLKKRDDPLSQQFGRGRGAPSTSRWNVAPICWRLGRGPAVSLFRTWLSRQPRRHVPLFDTTEHRVVRTVLERNQKRLLKRHPNMEAAIIDEVEAGLTSDRWHGLLYIMGWGAEYDGFVPLYIGITRKAGRTNPIGANLQNIRNNKGKLAGWGDSRDYHIGDLSQVLFRWGKPGAQKAKYERWAKTLFESTDPPTLRDTAYFVLIPWTDASLLPDGNEASLQDAEAALIELCSLEFEDALLNVEHKT